MVPAPSRPCLGCGCAPACAGAPAPNIRVHIRSRPCCGALCQEAFADAHRCCQTIQRLGIVGSSAVKKLVCTTFCCCCCHTCCCGRGHAGTSSTALAGGSWRAVLETDGARIQGHACSSMMHCRSHALRAYLLLTPGTSHRELGTLCTHVDTTGLHTNINYFCCSTQSAGLMLVLNELRSSTHQAH